MLRYKEKRKNKGLRVGFKGDEAVVVEAAEEEIRGGGRSRTGAWRRG